MLSDHFCNVGLFLSAFFQPPTITGSGDQHNNALNVFEIPPGSLLFAPQWSSRFSSRAFAAAASASAVCSFGLGRALFFPSPLLREGHFSDQDSPTPNGVRQWEPKR